ncbi:hypothetical protein ABZV77_11385 [Streptomyces sp. NPDC004732]|uniref:hypothetical protein n=1 Tax=Streptomyces sp. NPDC004732 TaxID=3154290 RepID=UPI0033A5A458
MEPPFSDSFWRDSYGEHRSFDFTNVHVKEVKIVTEDSDKTRLAVKNKLYALQKKLDGLKKTDDYLSRMILQAQIDALNEAIK